MADKIVSLEFNVNTSKGVTEINKVTQATEAATAASVDYEKQLNDIKKATDGAGFKELNAALKQYRDLALQAGTESPIGKQALAEAGELKDRLGDLRTQIATTGQDGRALQASLQLGGGIVAGFGAVQGVMALVGSESEDLQKTLVKLQAAQAALVSIEEIRSVLEKESALRITATAIAEKARAAATAISTFATSASTTALKAFRIALIGTGIGAIVVALGALASSMNLFGDETEDASKKVDKLNKDLEKQKDLTSKLNDEVDRNAEIQKLKAQIAGKTEAEISKIEKEAQDQKVKNLFEYYQRSQKIYDAIKAAKPPAEDLEKFKKNEQEAYDAYLAAINERNLLALQKEKELSDKQREQEKAAREKAAADLKKWREDRQALEKRIKEEAIDDALKVAAAEKEAEAAKTIAIQEEIKKRDQARQEQLDGEKSRNDREKQEAKELNDLKINLALQGFDLINQLTALTENNNKESAKRAFNVNKAFQLAQATIEGYRGTLKAYQEAPPGLKIISAGLAAAFAALQIAKISQTKFNSAKFENTTPQTTTPGAGIVTAAPTTQTQSTILNQQQAQPQNIKAYVVESEITKTQKRVNSIIETASI